MRGLVLLDKLTLAEVFVVDQKWNSSQTTLIQTRLGFERKNIQLRF